MMALRKSAAETAMVDEDEQLELADAGSPAPPAGAKPPAVGWSRGQYNLLFRVLGSRGAAKKVMRAMAQRPRPLEQSELLWIREVAVDALGEGAVDGTLLSRNHRVLSGLPDERRLPYLEPGFDVAGNERDLKEALEPQLLAVMELLFVDRYLPAEVAALTSVSLDHLFDFLTRLMMALGHLERWPHSSDSCPTSEDLVRDRLQATLVAAAGGAPRSGLAPAGDHESCETCEVVRRMSQDLVDLLARDSRILSFSDPRLIAKALDAPLVKLDAEPPRPRPPRDPERAEAAPKDPLPRPDYRMWYTIAGGGALLLFYVIFATASSFMSGSTSKTHSGFDKGLIPLKGRTVGTWNDLTGGSGSLSGDQDLTSPQGSPTYMTFENGVQAVLSPGGQAQIRTGGIVVQTGKVHVKVTSASEQQFVVKVGTLIAHSQDAEFDAFADATSPVRFDVQSGTLDVVNARGETHPIRAGQRLRMNP